MYSSPKNKYTRAMISKILGSRVRDPLKPVRFVPTGGALTKWHRYVSEHRQEPYKWSFKKIGAEYRKEMGIAGPGAPMKKKRAPSAWNIYFGEMRKAHPKWAIKRIGAEWQKHKKTMGLAPTKKKPVNGRRKTTGKKRGPNKWNKFYTKMKKQHPEWKQKKISAEWKAHKKLKGIVTPKKKAKKTTKAKRGPNKWNIFYTKMKRENPGWTRGDIGDEWKAYKASQGIVTKARKPKIALPVEEVSSLFTPERYRLPEGFDPFAYLKTPTYSAPASVPYTEPGESFEELERMAEMEGFGLRGGFFPPGMRARPNWPTRIERMKKMLPGLSRKMALAHGGIKYARRRRAPKKKSTRRV